MIFAYIVAASLVLFICYPTYQRWQTHRRDKLWTNYIDHLEDQGVRILASDRWIIDDTIDQ